MSKYYRFQALPFDDADKNNAGILSKYYNDIRSKKYIILGRNYYFKKNINSYDENEIKKIIEKEAHESGNNPKAVLRMFNFFREIKRNDLIFVYFQKGYPFSEIIKEKSLIGIVTNDEPYEFNEHYGIFSTAEDESGHNHILHVQWLPDLYDIGQGGKIHDSLSEIINKEFIQKLKDIVDSHQKSNLPKNIIIYGPPGTGKTYKTKEKSIKIMSG